MKGRQPRHTVTASPDGVAPLSSNTRPCLFPACVTHRVMRIDPPTQQVHTCPEGRPCGSLPTWPLPAQNPGGAATPLRSPIGGSSQAVSCAEPAGDGRNNSVHARARSGFQEVVLYELASGDCQFHDHSRVFHDRSVPCATLKTHQDSYIRQGHFFSC